MLIYQNNCLIVFFFLKKKPPFGPDYLTHTKANDCTFLVNKLRDSLGTVISIGC